jgi:hypothetical protein
MANCSAYCLYYCLSVNYGTILPVVGDEKHKTCPASSCPLLPGLHILRGWDPHVGPVERAERVHGHIMGLRMVSAAYMLLAVFRIHAGAGSVSASGSGSISQR